MGVDAEVIFETSDRFRHRDAKQLCRQVDHVAVRGTSKAVKMIVIEPQAGMMVVVERTAGHAVPADLQSVPLGGVRRRDSRLDGFDSVHRITPLK